MASVLPEIDETLAAWMETQPMFFVATAPLGGSVAATVMRMDDVRFPELRSEFGKERTVGQRAVIVIDTERVSDAVGS